MKFHKDEFVNNFIYPVSLIAEKAKVICDKVTASIVNTPDNMVVLYAKYKDNISDKVENVNIPDLKKFIRMMAACTVDDTGIIDIPKKDNKLTHKSKGLKFEYYLLDDAYIPRVPLSKEKIEALTYDTTFHVPTEKLQEILKLSSITTDTEKFYLYTEDENVCVDLDDKERQNITNMSIVIADVFGGASLTKPVPICLSALRILALEDGVSVEVGINSTLKIACFSMQYNKVELRYIISGLVK